MVYLPRGIDPELLISQVLNTMPYLLPSSVSDMDRPQMPLDAFRPTVVLKELRQRLEEISTRSSESRETKELKEKLTHLEYFQLCLSSHYLSCGTPVPTDVDNQIRLKLWPEQLPLEIALEMSDFVLESRKWDFKLVSTRFTCGAQGGPWENETLSGHLGEWFTVSTAAYCALRKYKNSAAQKKCEEILAHISDEVHRHSEIFGSLWRAQEGVECLKSSATIAHNFGDLDRVIDMWELSVADPLRLEFYKLTALPFDSNGNLRYLGRLWSAGELYKTNLDGSSMAFENHRHFALRKPKCLRRQPDFLIPIGPFFDQWGKRVGAGLPPADVLEVVEALQHGWTRLPKTIGYGRALRSLSALNPSLDLSDLRQNPHFKEGLETSQESFERKWNELALQALDDIPSRA